MKFQIKNCLEKIRALPEKQKKIILWVIVGILAVVMGLFWFRGVINSLSKLSESVEPIKLPDINMSELPSPSNNQSPIK